MDSADPGSGQQFITLLFTALTYVYENMQYT